MNIFRINKKIKFLFLVSLLFNVNIPIYSQNIAITDDDSYSANSSAMLDVKSINKGVLLPRLSTVQRLAVVNPATGLLVFDTNQNNFYFYDGSEWLNVSSDNDTESRDNAGLRGDAGAKNGFYETNSATIAENWPADDNSWWHLLDIRHSNLNNNFAMQFAGSFFNQNLYFRKVNDNPSQAWSKIFTSNDISATNNYIAKYTSSNSIGTSLIYDNGTNIGIGTSSPVSKLTIGSGDVALDNNFAFNWKTTGGSYRTMLYLRNDDILRIGNDATDGSNAIAFYTENHPNALFINNSGNIGIGTTSPTTIFDVNGVITSNGGNSTNWNTAYGWGNHASAGYITTEADADPTNELQVLSISNDTINLTNGSFVKLPTIDYNNLINKPSQVIFNVGVYTGGSMEFNTALDFEYPSGIIDDANDKFIVPESGYYFLHFQAFGRTYTADPKYLEIGIFINGVQKYIASNEINNTGTTKLSCVISTVVLLSKDDEITVSAYSGGGGIYGMFTFDKESFFTGYKIY